MSEPELPAGASELASEPVEERKVLLELEQAPVPEVQVPVESAMGPGPVAGPQVALPLEQG